jgi:hypothetical protein
MRHPLITISDLQSLTDAELERLEASLRHILETAIDLSETERTTIALSLGNIRAAIILRQTAMMATAP